MLVHAGVFLAQPGLARYFCSEASSVPALPQLSTILAVIASLPCSNLCGGVSAGVQIGSNGLHSRFCIQERSGCCWNKWLAALISFIRADVIFDP